MSQPVHGTLQTSQGAGLQGQRPSLSAIEAPTELAQDGAEQAMPEVSQESREISPWRTVVKVQRPGGASGTWDYRGRDPSWAFWELIKRLFARDHNTEESSVYKGHNTTPKFSVFLVYKDPKSRFPHYLRLDSGQEVVFNQKMIEAVTQSNAAGEWLVIRALVSQYVLFLMSRS